MKKRASVFLSLLFIIFLAGCAGQYTKPIPETTKQHLIEINSTSFNPSELKINRGETVVFINKDFSSHWPASGVHPTHNLYPEKGGCIGSKFDACGSLKENENFTFTFKYSGTWSYHDHIRPGIYGKIMVE